MREGYLKRKEEFDWFIESLAKGEACAKGPKGFEHYNALYRIVCLGETPDVDPDPGPYYPFILLAHYFWRSGDVCKACVLLEKARGGRKPLHREKDEDVAIELLKAAISEGVNGVRHIETEDSHWSWASAFKDLLIAELDPRERTAALQRVKKALGEFFETEKVSGYIAEMYNIFEPYISDAPYIYIYYVATELEKRELPPRRSVREVLRRVVGKN